MNCPSCKSDDTIVVNKRNIGDHLIRRRRECRTCGYRWTTAEIPADDYNKLLSTVDEKTRATSSGAIIVSRSVYGTMKNKGNAFDELASRTQMLISEMKGKIS